MRTCIHVFLYILKDPEMLLVLLVCIWMCDSVMLHTGDVSPVWPGVSEPAVSSPAAGTRSRHWPQQPEDGSQCTLGGHKGVTLPL